MTPEEAATLLDVHPDSAVDDIDRAWRHQARRWHPDLQGTLSPSARAHAAAEFVRASEARDILLAQRRRDGAGSRSDDAGESPAFSAPRVGPEPNASPDPSPYRRVEFSPGSSIYGDDGARPWPSSWLFWTWTGLLVVACAVSFFGWTPPYAAIDLVGRLLPLVFFATAFALTGRTLFFRGMQLFVIISAVLTVVFASFGTLFSLLLLLVPVIGLGILGMRMARLRQMVLRATR